MGTRMPAIAVLLSWRLLLLVVIKAVVTAMFTMVSLVKAVLTTPVSV
jgi:hypothetical protein